jgi:hypothetical protein
LATGTKKWAQANFGSRAVIAADGKLIALSGTGELMVAPVSPAGFEPWRARRSWAEVLDRACPGQRIDLLPQRSRRARGVWILRRK